MWCVGNNTVHFTGYSVHIQMWTLDRVHSTLYSLQFTWKSVEYSDYTVYCILYTLYRLQRTLKSMQSYLERVFDSGTKLSSLEEVHWAQIANTFPIQLRRMRSPSNTKQLYVYTEGTGELGIIVEDG